MKEEWKWVAGYEGRYEISDCGRVRSFVRGKPHILKPYKDGYGYHKVSLMRSGIEAKYLLHRLVAQTFIPNPLNLPQVNHLDGDKQNAKVVNLEWVTSSQNHRHAFMTGLVKRKLNPEKVIEIRALARAGQSRPKIARIYKVNPFTIAPS